jgi:cytochrome c oxidase subunit 2
VVVMEPSEFQAWLGGGAASDTPVAAGEKLFTSLACITCHTEGAGARGPVLTGITGTKVELQGGGTAVADDAYLRESILNPQAKIVAGFQPIMPTFQGLVTEEQLLQLIAYIKSLQPGATRTAGNAAAPEAAQNPGQPKGAR